MTLWTLGAGKTQGWQEEKEEGRARNLILLELLSICFYVRHYIYFAEDTCCTSRRLASSVAGVVWEEVSII